MRAGPGSRTRDFDYELPESLVARYPEDRRDRSRLLVLDRSSGSVAHKRFHDLPDLVREGDLVVVNDTRVFPARLLGRKPTGAPAEVLLLTPLDPAPGSEPAGRRWEALVRPGGKLKPGRRIDVAPGLSVRIVDSIPGGRRVVELETELDPMEAVERHGHVPLPPYLGRDDEPLDRERYQTVYGTRTGSVAAPTAGLHFTPELIDRIRGRGVDWATITLHVGVGTFRPVEHDDPRDHEMHAERFSVTAEAARAVDACRRRSGRVWAVGTTVVRTLESLAKGGGRISPGTGQTDLFIRPGFEFRVVDGLVTNFHLPRSTLLMLVSAFAGTASVLSAYREAVGHGYRFYSYGDAMAVVP